MKIVLISTDESVVALGAKTLSSCLTEHGFESSVVLMATRDENYRKFHWEDLYEICKDTHLIGISCTTHGVPRAIAVMEELKEEFSIPIVIGGIHASIDPESLLPHFEMICHGEGEDVITELACRLRKNEQYDNIPGLWVKRNGNVVRNPSQPLKKDLNEYPIPEYDLRRQFILQKNRLVSLEPWHIDVEDFVVLGSRGCPHRCAYCCTRKIKNDFPWRKRVHHYSVDYLINHLKLVNLKFPKVKSFWIEDDTFFAKKLDEIKEFAARYKKEINKPFKILISPWTFSDEKLKPLVDSGMNKIIMGIQSGSEQTNMEIYERRIPNQKTMKIVNSLHKYPNIGVWYDFIGMNPFEKEDDLINTINFIKKLPFPFYIYNNNLAFYPGTELYNRAVREGRDISLRVKHSDPDVGYAILKKESLKHKLFHFLLLFMAGGANAFRIGKIPRVLISEKFIDFYKFTNRRFPFITDEIIAALCSLLIYARWKQHIKKLMGPKFVMKSRFLLHSFRRKPKLKEK